MTDEEKRLNGICICGHAKDWHESNCTYHPGGGFPVCKCKTFVQVKPLEPGLLKTSENMTTSAIFCNHANESGVNCDCRGDCYCRRPGGMCEFRLKPGVMIIENPEAPALDVDTFLDKIKAEYMRASRKFKPFSSKHEGYAVLLEEIDELWEAVKTDKGWTKLEEEGIQVAAMALRFLMDVVNAKRTLRQDGSGT